MSFSPLINQLRQTKTNAVSDNNKPSSQAVKDFTKIFDADLSELSNNSSLKPRQKVYTYPVDKLVQSIGGKKVYQPYISIKAYDKNEPLIELVYDLEQKDQTDPSTAFVSFNKDGTISGTYMLGHPSSIRDIKEDELKALTPVLNRVMNSFKQNKPKPMKPEELTNYLKTIESVPQSPVISR